MSYSLPEPGSKKVLYRIVCQTRQKHRHCHKKLVRLLFDFGVMVLSTQRTRIVNNRLRPSHSVKTAVVRRQSRTEYVLLFINIWRYFYLKPEYFPGGASGKGSVCINRISGGNFYRVFCSNYGAILLSFRDMTTGRAADGPTSASDECLAVKNG